MHRGNFTSLWSSAGSLREMCAIVKVDVDVCSCCTLPVELTRCCNNSSHGESISDALSHCNNIRNNPVTLKTPHVAARPSESSLDLLGIKPILLIILKRHCREGCTAKIHAHLTLRKVLIHLLF